VSEVPPSSITLSPFLPPSPSICNKRTSRPIVSPIISQSPTLQT
jgi:hypothetical protein